MPAAFIRLSAPVDGARRIQRSDRPPAALSIGT